MWELRYAVLVARSFIKDQLPCVKRRADRSNPMTFHCTGVFLEEKYNSINLIYFI